MTQTLHLIGYASGNASGDPRSAMGPLTVQAVLPSSDQFKWVDTLYPRDNQQKLDALEATADLNTRLAQHIQLLTQNKQRFCTIGGDHSCALGTWSGAVAGLDGPLGLIWIDAHMDAHTPETTPSNNIHGMPIACLLGHGPEALKHILTSQPKLQPEHIFMIGLRSYESEEEALLKQLGVTCHTMDSVHTTGLSELIDEALTTMAQADLAGFGLSVDIDGFDPSHAPAVATAVPGGLDAQAFLADLPKIINHPQFIGTEIAEFNPALDQDQRTERLILQLLDFAAQ